MRHADRFQPPLYWAGLDCSSWLQVCAIARMWLLLINHLLRLQAHHASTVIGLGWFSQPRIVLVFDRNFFQPHICEWSSTFPRLQEKIVLVILVWFHSCMLTATICMLNGCAGSGNSVSEIHLAYNISDIYACGKTSTMILLSPYMIYLAFVSLFYTADANVMNPSMLHIHCALWSGDCMFDATHDNPDIQRLILSAIWSLRMSCSPADHLLFQVGDKT